MARLTALVLVFLLSAFVILPRADAQATVFTFQGKLQSSSASANGNFDFEFLLFDAASGGSQIGSTITRNGVAVTDGIFLVNLDFGASFPGANRFLEIRVRQSGGGGFTPLSPRQSITSAPYSVTSLNATNATTATNALSLGGVAANQYLQTNGNGSALTNLDAGSITSGTLSNARLGQIPTANIADNAVTAAKIANAQVVKGMTVGATTLTDNVTLAAGANITITPAGNTVTIASTGGGGVGGSGATNTIPLWSAGTSLGNSLITQSGGTVQLPSLVSLAVTASGNNVSFGSPNGETGMTISGATGRADLRFDGSTLKLVAGPAGGTPTSTNGIAISTAGNVGIGFTVQDQTRLSVDGMGLLFGIAGRAGAVGVYGEGGTGVEGFSSIGTGVRGLGAMSGSIAVRANGTSWFRGDTTPLSSAITGGPGPGVAIGSFGDFGYVFGFDYGANTSRTLALNHPGGRVGIGTSAPDQTLSVNGNASKSGGGSWLAFSDERLKNIKGSFSGGLKAVMKLQPLRYEYKTDNTLGLRSEGEHVGFSAQAVEQIIPEAVTKNDQGYRMVNNDPIMWAMLNAVKEQQAQIEQLKTQVRRLQIALRGRKRSR